MAPSVSDRSSACPLTNRWLQLVAGMLHTAKGVAALLIPLSEPMVAATGSWQTVFAIAIGMNVVAAALGIGVLRPLRAARMKSVAIAE